MTRHYPPRPSRYYARFRDLVTRDGETISALTTRYASGIGLRPCKGPRGGKAYQEFHRGTYYHGGRFYGIANVSTGGDSYETATWAHVLVPLTGVIWDCHAAQSREQGITPVRIECKDGYPVHVDDDAGTIWDSRDSEPWEPVANFLGLNKRKRRSPARLSTSDEPGTSCRPTRFGGWR